jgi:magnesium chelatase subunit D
MKSLFPFSAVVGQDQLKLALLLVAIDPGIGGVLVKGERGTAKSTIARGLAELLPAKSDARAAPFVELPLGATEDRVVGSLDLTTVLRDGQTQLKSGVLARADGGVLYVDEVNLLADHLVDLLLDAAASGWVTVERDGVSASEAARFVLIGTMNPEEGDLRPQFMDRFGLSVDVRGLTDPELRRAAIASRLAFDASPSAAIEAARPAQEHLRQSILDARARLSTLAIDDAHLALVAEIANEHRLDGIRGDLAIIKAARALAAWERAGGISAEHIRRAAEFALPHRTRRKKPRGASPQSSATPESAEPKRQAAATLHPAPALRTAGAISLLTDAIDHEGGSRRGTDALAERRGSRAIPFDHTAALAVNETLIAAASRGVRVDERGVTLAATDLMQYDRRGPGHANVLFLVDASGSMASERRLQIAKGAALELLKSNYQRRDEVALMVFRGEGTDLVLPFTDRVASVERALADVPSGGRSPLARALVDATQLLQTRESAVLVIFTDGRANVSVNAGDPWEEALAACNSLREACAGAVVIDCEPGPIFLGRARQLADALMGECVALDALQAAELAVRIHRRAER